MTATAWNGTAATVIGCPSTAAFTALNCSALPEQLLESELFGFERGAFTGAQQAKPGQIELAAGGVLFLDEVAEMSASAQAKFLRVLQEREFQRLGSTRMLKANVRVIAATNRDLNKALERGDFREDLFYRLQVFDIKLPPLAETDPIVRELVARLSSHPTIAAWLATKGLIANFTVTTLTIAEGRTPVQFLRPIAPRGRFRTRSAGEELFVDPRSYDRYNLHADAVAALDSVGTASLYLTLKPRISDAYRELGYPEGDFDRVLERAIGLLLETPVLDERVALHPNAVTYAYSDPKLESLSPAQKQLLRLGPRNGQAIRGKLEEIAALLKLQPAVSRR